MCHRKAAHRGRRQTLRLRSSFAFEAMEQRTMLSAPEGDDDSVLLTAFDEQATISAESSSVQLLDPQTISGHTGHKPQSKLWNHANHWWSVFADSAGTGVWRLDGTAWTKVLNFRTGAYQADVKPVGDLVHVLLEKDSESLFATVEYVPGTPGTYQRWSVQPALVPVPLSSATETATLDLDSTGKIWVAFDTTTSIQVVSAALPYTTWSRPVVLANDTKTDDISAITSFPDGKIGVLWSNQATQRFGFRLHDDTSPPDEWSADEVPAGQSALQVGSGMADDHLNVAVTSDGTLFAAVKTSYNTSGFTQIGLLVRRPDGQWDDLHHVDTNGTRAIVDVSETQNRLLVVYRAEDTAGPIVYKESSLDAIAFGPRVTLLSDSALNNPSSLKQPFENELVVIASKNGTLDGARISFGAPVNQPPVVSAGSDQAVTLFSGASLNGTISDDGLPNPPGIVTTIWSRVSGPGSVTFADSNAVDTTATFSAVGTYVLELSADDGAAVVVDQIVIKVTDQTSLTQTFQDGVSSYAGTTDTRIRKADPNKNLGTHSILTLDASPEWSSLLRFDISTIPPGSTILGATITLNVTDESANLFEIYELKRPWSETEATWNSASAGVPWEVAGATGPSDRGSIVLGLVGGSTLGATTVDLNADGRAVVQSWVNNPSINHGFALQNYTTATDSLTVNSREAAAAARPKLQISYATSSQNQPPVVSAGSDQAVTLFSGASLNGTISDDGLPNPPGVVTTIWSRVSGPGSVTFANPNAVDTTATFSAVGTYVLELSADDGAAVVVDQIVIEVTDQTSLTQKFQDGVSSYAGTTDTRIRKADPNKNLGTHSILTLDASPEWSSLLRFDISTIPTGSTILGATITLNVTDESANLFEIYELKRPWSETEATWNSASAGVPWEVAGATGPSDRGSIVLGLVGGSTLGATFVDLNADGRAVVQSWVNNPSINHGFAIQNYTSATDSLDVSSSEAATTVRPKLEIKYAPPNNPETLVADTAVVTNSSAALKPISTSLKTEPLDSWLSDIKTPVEQSTESVVPPIAKSVSTSTNLPRFVPEPSLTVAQPDNTSRNWLAWRLAQATLVDQLLGDDQFLSNLRGKARSIA